MLSGCFIFLNGSRLQERLGTAGMCPGAAATRGGGKADTHFQLASPEVLGTGCLAAVVTLPSQLLLQGLQALLGK